jgi:hypothetical protein
MWSASNRWGSCFIVFFFPQSVRVDYVWYFSVVTYDLLIPIRSALTIPFWTGDALLNRERASWSGMFLLGWGVITLFYPRAQNVRKRSLDVEKSEEQYRKDIWVCMCVCDCKSAGAWNMRSDAPVETENGDVHWYGRPTRRVIGWDMDQICS